jgi:hypothetical protein
MKRPLPVTLISLLFIVAGISGIIYHASDWRDITTQPGETILVFMLRLLAIVGGIFSWRGANWARWLLVAWIAYHVYLSFYHTIPELAMHGVIMALVMAALFNRKASTFFQKSNQQR